MKQLKLYCMRGAPGCGKSTHAQEIAKLHESLDHLVHVFSTDDFWGSPYNFVAAKIREAHLWNQNRTMLAMLKMWASEQGGVVIVDNTHISAWEMKPYVEPASLLKFDIQIIEPRTDWAFNPEECAKRTIHNVPPDTIRGMIARYERNLTVEMCINAKSPYKKG